MKSWLKWNHLMIIVMGITAKKQGEVILIWVHLLFWLRSSWHDNRNKATVCNFLEAGVTFSFKQFAWIFLWSFQLANIHFWFLGMVFSYSPLVWRIDTDTLFKNVHQSQSLSLPHLWSKQSVSPWVSLLHIHFVLFLVLTRDSPSFPDFVRERDVTDSQSDFLS